ncbi:MAG: glycosyltransferase family 1 protein, partial [Campylobacterota bacterium]|nr:glycosyltransferase family 1 protein [Campylobacterota bacterium]
MTIYIDISILEKNRANTGIQRVLKEFVQRVVFNDNDSYTFKILAYNWDSKNMELLGIQEVKSFLKETASFQFEKNNPIDLKTIKVNETTIFLDMDSPWYAPISRDQLYPTLKENGFLIFNFIYDLVPIILPEYAHPNTVKIFKPFLDAVYRYSDTVLFDSLSANNDFIDYKNSLNITRDIPSRVVGLGSDFFKSTLKINDNYINNILEKKYILFVGTIEPRKNQENVLDAFEILSEKYPDLNLVFIGKNGWKVENLIHKIKNHPLKEKQLFWLNNIDDDTLSYFYQNAFIVTYLSKYEGYGLPIAESLGYGNITIASKNSSMYEVAHDTADYISYNTQNELIDIISLYCDNINLYNLKKEYIKDNFKITTWDTFSNSIFTIFDNFEQSIYLTQNHLKKLQFVFISIEIDSIKGTVEACDKYVDFIKEYIVITAPKFISKFENITTKNKITIIDETTILKEYKDGFSKRDHVSKNWILRTSLLNIENLDDEFIMLDDDNRPLKKITIDKYITKEGRYNGYYFHNLLEWNHKGTEYDIGQQNMKKIIANENYELLSYSSHAPQIINKKIFKEATDKFFKIGLTTPIDEWSIYFNYAVSRYPYAFNKKVFETLNWPANPYQWDYPYSQTEISFENYYKEIYD